VFRWAIIVLLISVAVPSLAEEASKRVYSESFKKGATRVTEQTINVTLTPEHSKQDFKILDSLGNGRYTLRFVPDIPAGDTKILGWLVRLADMHHKIYESVLPTSPDLARDSQQFWWLDARQYSKTPLLTERVFKVEQFYCVIDVKDAKRLSPGQPYVNQIDVTVKFTNMKP
jgi:hypothetical protein